MLLTLEIQKEFSNNVKTEMTVSVAAMTGGGYLVLIWKFLLCHYKDGDGWERCRCIWVRILPTINV